MATRTFRINPEYDKILNEEAEKHGLSISALLNQIIRQYVVITRFAEKNPSITLSTNTFAPVLDSTLDEKLAKAAEKTGSIIPEEALLLQGKRLDLDTVLWLLDINLGRYGNWFEYNHSVMNDKERIHLSHQLNHKWSIFLEKYLSSMFQSILDMKPEIERRENSVTLYIPRRTNINQLLNKRK